MRGRPAACRPALSALSTHEECWPPKARQPPYTESCTVVANKPLTRCAVGLRSLVVVGGARSARGSAACDGSAVVRTRKAMVTKVVAAWRMVAPVGSAWSHDATGSAGDPVFDRRFSTSMRSESGGSFRICRSRSELERLASLSERRARRRRAEEAAGGCAGARPSSRCGRPTPRAPDGAAPPR